MSWEKNCSNIHVQFRGIVGCLYCLFQIALQSNIYQPLCPPWIKNRVMPRLNAVYGNIAIEAGVSQSYICIISMFTRALFLVFGIDIGNTIPRQIGPEVTDLGSPLPLRVSTSWCLHLCNWSVAATATAGRVHGLRRDDP